MQTSTDQRFPASRPVIAAASSPKRHGVRAAAPGRRWGLVAAVLAAVMGGLPVAALATSPGEWPTKTVSVTVPYAPGGGVDMLARLIGAEVAKKGQAVVVENKAGAGSTVGTAYVAARAKDGYSLLMMNDAYALAPAIYRSLPYDPRKDLTAVVPIAYAPMLVVVPANSKFKTMADLNRAGQSSVLSWGSCGSGTDPHLAGEMMNMAFKTKNVHVPYKGCAPALVDVLSGQLDYAVVTMSGAVPYVSAGKMLALAITSKDRSKVFPSVPTVAESGAPGFHLSQWQGLAVPAGTPEDVQRAIYQTVSDIVHTDAMQRRLLELGYSPAAEDRLGFQKRVLEDIDRFSDLAKKIGLKVE